MIRDIMIDFETLSTNMLPCPGSFAAVLFDASTRYSIFDLEAVGDTQLPRCFTYFDIDSCINAGLDIMSSTIEWWANQPSKEFIFAPPGKDKLQVQQFAPTFVTWMAEALINANYGTIIDPAWIQKNVRIWCRGMDFDMSLVRRLFEIGGLQTPWRYDAGRDLRTVLDDRYASTKPEFYKQGLKSFPQHNPMADCLAQIWMLTNSSSDVEHEMNQPLPKEVLGSSLSVADSVASAPTREEIYSVAACVFTYCPHPDVCKEAQGGCIQVAKGEDPAMEAKAVLE